jgi:mannose-1-phosphate guanylyltransferase
MRALDLSRWPALVLTAGLAIRLRPLSEVRAKAALPLGGEPLVGRILTWLRASGVRHAVLNLHHRPESITRLVGDGAAWDMHVRYSWEREVLGSAGGARHALTLLDAPRFLIVNGDTLTDCSLAELAQHHLDTGARVTMAVVPRTVDRAVAADPSGVVTGFGPGDEHFIGVQAVDADVFGSLDDEVADETVKKVYPRLIVAQPGSVRAYRSRAEFLDVGTPSDYLKTAGIVATREGRALDRGADVRIHATAAIRHSLLWDRVTVCERAVLTDCIVADDVVVPAEARYEQCVLIRGADGLTVTPF